jgi:prolyl oligopeptidase
MAKGSEASIPGASAPSHGNENLRSLFMLVQGGREIRWLMLAAAVALCMPDGIRAQTKAPPTPVDKVKEVLHGVELVDPYRWLEEQNSPRTREWIAAQNAYTQSILKTYPGREALAQRLGELLKIDVQSMPVARGGRYFFTKRLANQDQSVLYVRPGLAGKDEILIDPHGLSADHTISVGLLDVSMDGKLLAYSVRQGGEDEVAVQFFDVDSKKDLPDRLPKARYFGIAIKGDNGGFYYSRFEKDGPRVYYHTPGTSPTDDRRLFGDGYGRDKIISVSLSDDGRWLVLNVSHGSAAKKTEIYYQDVTKQGSITALVNDVEARFQARFEGNRAFVETNWLAPNGRLFAVDLAKPARQNWQEIVPAGKAVMQGFALVGGQLAVNYLDNVTSRVKLFDPTGRPLRDLQLPGLGTTTGLSGEWMSQESFYSFTSFVTPATIFRYDLATGQSSEWSKPNIPIDPGRFTIEQVFYSSKDGTRIPMFLVYRKDLKKDGNNPTLLTGYGGFNISRTPAFSPLATVWVENGGIYALANLRGGGEFGEEWHRAGMLEKKQNVFDDFIAAAEYLVEAKYTAPKRLAIQGGSNGGLLVGAALTQRPDLFQAVICAVPLLDMVRYHQFLVARFWVPEYGSSEDPKQFTYIYAYSPYHHVKSGTAYPAVLFVSGDSDTRVDPLHARKMCALLQASTSSDRPILLHYDTKGGHAGGKPVPKQIEDAVDELSFLMLELGVKK